MQKLIINAIRERRRLKLRYGGVTAIVEPHTFGINESGHEELSCFQVKCEGRLESRKGWKDILLLNIESIEADVSLFDGPRLGYVRNTKSMHEIFEQL